ncbi:glycosyltransferase 87 family protein [Kribbella sp. NPDC006257]|uniref:glycosyltransferase 87 family protein n=1 Tax=Kribbella sp. NPDC006257 TaxID=3156738 RepID=UPI0033BE226F
MTVAPTRVEQPRRRTGARSVRRVLVAVAGLIVVLGYCCHRWPPTDFRYDLNVYVVATKEFLTGSDIYTGHLVSKLELGFTYPPFAVLCFVPLVLAGTAGGRALMFGSSMVSLLLIGWLITRAVRPAWPRHRIVLATIACAAIAVKVEPVASTFDLGQVNLVLMAMVLVDLLGITPYRFRGVLIGIATGIKLTPGIFILYLLVVRKYREASVATAATAGTVVAGALAMPTASLNYWTGYLFDPGRAGHGELASNQSLRGVIARLAGGSAPLLLLVVPAVCVFGLLAARRVHERGHTFEAMLLAATTGLLISPISWTTHWVWALPIGIVGWLRTYEAFRARHTRLAAGLGTAALLWSITFTVGLPWKAQYEPHEPLSSRALSTNAYALCAVLAIAGALVFTRRKVTS